MLEYQGHTVWLEWQSAQARSKKAWVLGLSQLGACGTGGLLWAWP